MPGGRPTKYTETLVKKARAYVKGDWKREENGGVIPTIAGLSLYLGVARDTIHEWANDPKKALFSDIINDLRSIQRQLLMSKGLSGDFNSGVARLILGHHGYREKQDIKQENSGQVTLNVVRKVVQVDEPEG